MSVPSRTVRFIAGVILAISLLSGFVASAAGEDLFVSRVFVPKGSFDSSIEGPVCELNGTLYAVSYARRGTIGMVTPDGQASLFVELPAGSTGNGIRFDRAGNMLVADYTGHNVLKVDMTTREVTVLAHEPSMSQPNDLAIGANDIVYASDPNWSNSSGRVWRITPDGTVTLLDSGLGTTNGIEVSPDERTLYVNESTQHRVLAYDLSADGEISNKRVFVSLPGTTLDGMRCDTAGNLYVTRMGAGTIAIVSPSGEIIREVPLIGKNPSNICFGGPDGRTCYVTMASEGTIETFRTDTPGRSWKLYQDQITAVAELPASPRRFTLARNYPNPFNPSTTIEYTLNREAGVELVIFNMAGQRVAVLKQGVEKAGKYGVTWNARNMPSGVYFAQIQVEGVRQTRKMVLVR